MPELRGPHGGAVDRSAEEATGAETFLDAPAPAYPERIIRILATAAVVSLGVVVGLLILVSLRPSPARRSAVIAAAQPSEPARSRPAESDPAHDNADPAEVAPAEPRQPAGGEAAPGRPGPGEVAPDIAEPQKPAEGKVAPGRGEIDPGKAEPAPGKAAPQRVAPQKVGVGKAAVRPEDKADGQAAEPAGPRFAVEENPPELPGDELTQIVDPVRDTIRGPVWERLPQGIAAPGTFEANPVPPVAPKRSGERVLRIPLRLPEDFVLRVRLTRRPESGTVRVFLADARGEGGLSLAIDSAGTIRLEERGPLKLRIARLPSETHGLPPLVEYVGNILPREETSFAASSREETAPTFGLAPAVPGVPGLPGFPAIPGLPIIPGLPLLPGVTVSPPSRPRNATGPVRRWNEDGKPQEVALTVRPERLRLEADGIVLADAPLGTDAFRLPATLRGLTAPRELGLSADGPAVFHQVRIERIGAEIREPIPDIKALQHARHRIREHTTRFAQMKEPHHKMSWVATFRQEMPGATNAAGAFVAWTTLRDRACETGQIEYAAECAALLGKRFDVDAALERAATFRRLAEHPDNLPIAPVRPGGDIGATELRTGEFRQALVVGFEESMTREEYGAANEYLGALRRCCNAANSAPAAAVLDHLQVRLVEARKSFDATAAARETIRHSPDDPAACLALGLHYGLVREEWTNARPYLERSGDAEWVALASAERDADSAGIGFDPVLADRWEAQAARVPANRRDAVLRQANRRRIEPGGPLPAEVAAKLREAGTRALSGARAAAAIRYRNKIYLLVEQPLSWADATAWARLRGGEPVAIGSADEASFLRWYIDLRADSFHTPVTYWIGGVPGAGPAGWAWADGTKFGYAEWLDQPPRPGMRERLAVVRMNRKDTYWYPHPENMRLPFMVRWNARE